MLCSNSKNAYFDEINKRWFYPKVSDFLLYFRYCNNICISLTSLARFYFYFYGFFFFLHVFEDILCLLFQFCIFNQLWRRWETLSSNKRRSFSNNQMIQTRKKLAKTMMIRTCCFTRQKKWDLVICLCLCCSFMGWLI